MSKRAVITHLNKGTANASPVVLRTHPIKVGKGLRENPERLAALLADRPNVQVIYTGSSAVEEPTKKKNSNKKKKGQSNAQKVDSN